MKNNFLINLYLQQENENNFLATKYSSNKTEFKEIIDSLVIEKNNCGLKWIH